MGEIRLSVGQVNILNYLIVNVREVETPAIIVQHQVIPPPVPTSQNLLFSGLNDVVHYVDFRSSPDGIDQGLLLGTFVYDVKNETIIAERRFYRVDGTNPTDPVAGAVTIVDPYLANKTVYGIFREGFRPLITGEEWTQAGDTISFGPEPYWAFSSGEVWTVDITYAVAAPSAAAAPFPKSIIEITSDITLNDTHQNSLMEANGSTPILTVTFPPFSMIPDGTKYQFSTENGSQRYLKIVIDPGSVNYALVKGTPESVLYMGKCENLVLIKKGAYMRVDWKGDYTRVGEIVYRDIAPVNGYPHNGSWENIADFPRLYEWYIQDLDPSYFGTGSYPSPPANANRHKWCIDLVNGKIWFPDFGGLFFRSVDIDGNIDTERPAGDRKPGTFQTFAIQSHAHFTFYDNGNVSNKIVLNSFNYPVRRQGGGVDVGNVNYEYSICADNSNQPNIGRSSSTGGAETRPQNVNMGVYRIF